VSTADLVAGLLWLALTAYAVLAGADFGGGVWDLLARGPRSPEQRQAVASAMGPVWEANHVWLIFMITGLFTAFPIAFATLGVAVYLPLTLALVGIVLRGAAFVFRAHGRETLGPVTGWGAVFGAASLMAPFFLGTVAAAVATGSLRVGKAASASSMFTGWTTPSAILIGLFAVSLCAYLAATYLMVETEDRPALQADFRGRAILAALISGVLALLALFVVALQSPRLLESLTGRGLPLLVLAIVNGPVALWAVWQSRPRIARVAVIAQVVLVLWTWVVGQWPYLIPPDLTIAAAAAPPETLSAMLGVVAVGMALLLPSLWLLFRVFKSKNPAVTTVGPVER
jgi:cytochrome d ubiquinol oxidase subunit II